MSVSGLDKQQRHQCRELAVDAMELLLRHAPAVHYSQGTTRWDGITHHLIAAKGQYPTALDCSASVSWALAQGLLFQHHLHDIVNGDNWEGGYTGTLADHGRRVAHLHNVMRGDLVLYGPAPRFEHVAMVVGHSTINGERVPIVISQGSEAGPFRVVYNYRPDVGEFRRYI